MTRINTRSSQLRENNTNEEINYQFEEQDSLHIPDAVTNRFKDEGMTLGWLRITLKGQDDFKYIGKKMQEGWKFVDIKEVPEIEQIISLGAAAQNILLGIHEIGFSAVWRTGQMAFNPEITRQLGLEENFQIIGYLYVGTSMGKEKPLPEHDIADFLEVWS